MNITQAIADAECHGNHDLAYRLFIQLADDLATQPDVRDALTAEPQATGTRWGDAVAALVEYRFTRLSLATPDWALVRAGSRAEPWEPQRSTTPLPFPVDLDTVAEPFARRGILIEEDELASSHL